MGKGTREAEIQQRRHRKLKSRKLRQNRLSESLNQAKTRGERIRLAQEHKPKDRQEEPAQATSS
jgi:hypothetical protein